jgi:hypothetical protein
MDMKIHRDGTFHGWAENKVGLISKLTSPFLGAWRTFYQLFSSSSFSGPFFLAFFDFVEAWGFWVLLPFSWLLPTSASTLCHKLSQLVTHTATLDSSQGPCPLYAKNSGCSFRIIMFWDHISKYPYGIPHPSERLVHKRCTGVRTVPVSSTSR